MGGRIALELASKQPELAPRLVLFSTSMGLHDANERKARAEQDDTRAVDLREHGMLEFTRSWYELPMFAQFRAHASFARTRARRVIGDAGFGLGVLLVVLQDALNAARMILLAWRRALFWQLVIETTIMLLSRCARRALRPL